MLTEAQREAFTEVMESELNAYIDPDDITATRGTLSAFIATHGAPTEQHVGNGITIHYWRGFDCRSVFDLTRGNLYVADFGEARGAYVERGAWKRCRA